MSLKNCLLVVIVAFALVLRLLWLDRVPIAISSDELDYILDAKAIFLSGRDLTGKWSPLSLTPPPHRVVKAELPALLMAPLVGPMRLSLFSARLPYIILGTVLVAILFLVAKKFFDDKVALIVAIVAAINPWTFYFSRTSFEAPLALAFFMAAFYILISFKGWKILFAFPFLFLAFFSYIGTKLIFLPFVFIVCFYSWFFLNKKKFTRQYLILILLCLCVFGWFLISLKKQPAGERMGELLTPFHPLVIQRVESERRLSTGSPLGLLFANKPVAFIKLFLEKYLGILSANFFFLHGEGRATYSMWTHGMFYYLDLIFLVLGFCFLFVKNKRLWLFLIALAAIALLPAAISTVGTEYALRAVLLYPILILLTGLGIWFLVSLKKNKSYRFGLVSVLVLFYLLQLANFLNIYFFRNPIYNSEGFAFSQRVMDNYLNVVKSEARKILVVGGDSLGMLKHYLFYSQTLDKDNLPLIRAFIAEGDYHWENIHFLSKCPEDLMIDKEETIILLPGADCLVKEEHPYWLSISQLGGGGEISRIYNDLVCHQFSLNRYPTGIKFTDFKVEAMPLEGFCQKFISDLTGYSDFKRKAVL